MQPWVEGGHLLLNVAAVVGLGVQKSLCELLSDQPEVYSVTQILIISIVPNQQG